MRYRLLLAVVILGGIVVWARCSFNPRPAVSPAPNGLFTGCFQGAIDDVQITGSVTVVLEPPADSQDTLTLNGCIRTEIQPQPAVLAMLTGSVQATREEALVTAMPAGGGAPFSLALVREPAGDLAAVTIDVSNAGGAPFQQAANLPRCAPQLDCQQLAIAMRPAPQPVLELP